MLALLSALIKGFQKLFIKKHLPSSAGMIKQRQFLK